MGIKYVERSSCYSIFCCSNDCRSLNIEIRHMTTGCEFDSDLAKIYSRAEKPYVMGCCCLCRPHIDVRLEKEQKYIEKGREPFTCCEWDAEVYNELGELKYRIVGNCCQMDFCCGSSAEKILKLNLKLFKIKKLLEWWKK